MGQITIYLDDPTAKRVRTAASAGHTPVSAWIAGIIRERLSGQWPERIRSFAGAWKDLPEAEQIRRGQGKDIPREQV